MRAVVTFILLIIFVCLADKWSSCSGIWRWLCATYEATTGPMGPETTRSRFFLGQVISGKSVQTIFYFPPTTFTRFHKKIVCPQRSTLLCMCFHMQYSLRLLFWGVIFIKTIWTFTICFLFISNHDWSKQCKNRESDVVSAKEIPHSGSISAPGQNLLLWAYTNFVKKSYTISIWI